ncbi:hypothetical protein P8452_56082 [Trifolium repens]|nr:hypothetical protein P8452_56082 [Trifolium repens]
MSLSVPNRNLFLNIEEINFDRTSWNIRAKIIRLWQVSDFNRTNVPFSLEMVLMDAAGDKIHATIKKTLIYKFKNDLIEGKVYCLENMGVATNSGAYHSTRHPYKLNFQYSSLVQRLSNFEILKSPYNFVPISEVAGDLIGLFTGYGQEREVTNQNGTTTKLNVIVLEADGHKLQCTLFGPYVNELNAFIAAGDLTNAVVIFQLAKAKSFQGKMHIQNCMNCSVLKFNTSCPESLNFRESLTDAVETPSPLTMTQLSVESRVEPVDDFLYNTLRMTLQALKDATNESLNVVLATIKRILNPGAYWYTACVCSKAVIPDSRMFYCEKCNKHVHRIVPRFCIKVRVMDHTESTNFVIFDTQASSIFNRSCADMIQGAEPVKAKPSHNPKFEQSFRVRKICTDDAIIKQFTDKWEQEVVVLMKNNNVAGSLSTLMTKGKDVLVCESSNVLSEDYGTLSESSMKGKEVVVDGTPIGVSQDLLTKFSNAVVNLDDDSVDVVCEQEIVEVGVNKLKAAAVKDVETPSSAKPMGQHKKTVAKRVSPQGMDQEGENAPIKLLKRAVKIEKLP